MKKIATITFHAAHNYGSNLQAYALQEFIKKICDNVCKYKIINLRNDKQKAMYSIKNKTFKDRLKNIFFRNMEKQLEQKYEKFEQFINNNLDITKEYSNLVELQKENLDFEYYISGSDQLWNTNAYDFDWANYLEFVQKGKKISYAASFGPSKIEWTEEQQKRIKRDLEKYDCLSVREEGSFNNVKVLTGVEPQINVDPTMLLKKEDWKKLIEKSELDLPEKYIFFYSLRTDKTMFKIVDGVSKILKLPVIVSNYTGKKDYLKKYKKIYNVGPIEFLYLINSAELVLSSSFHGTVFSILLNRPFFAINGLKDFRINTLLRKTNLETRSIELNTVEEKCKKVFDISFENAEKSIEEERLKSEMYLKKALDIKID